MSIDSRYTWDSVRSGGEGEPYSRRRKFGFWVSSPTGSLTPCGWAMALENSTAP